MTENSAKFKAGLWVAIVFIVGIALGGVFGFFYGHRSVVSAANPAAPQLTEPQRRARRVEQLTQELGLTQAQSGQLDSILSQLHSDYKAVHDQSDAQLAAVRQKGREQIRAILTPDQKPKFEAFLQRLDEERRKNASQPPPPPSR